MRHAPPPRQSSSFASPPKARWSLGAGEESWSSSRRRDQRSPHVSTPREAPRSGRSHGADRPCAWHATLAPRHKHVRASRRDLTAAMSRSPPTVRQGARIRPVRGIPEWSGHQVTTRLAAGIPHFWQAPRPRLAKPVHPHRLPDSGPGPVEPPCPLAPRGHSPDTDEATPPRRDQTSSRADRAGGQRACGGTATSFRAFLGPHSRRGHFIGARRDRRPQPPDADPSLTARDLVHFGFDRQTSCSTRQRPSIPSRDPGYGPVIHTTRHRTVEPLRTMD